MPLEVRELIIKATIKEGASNSDSPVNGSSTDSSGGEEDPQLDIIQEVINRILAILHEKYER